VPYDVIVKDGLIVDGTGSAAFGGDLAIEAGRVVAVGEVSGEARRTIDADGRVVAPGFIDAHTHYDAQLLWDATANPSTAHGITTILMGNCGYTLAPVRSQDQDYLIGLFAAAEEVPKLALETYAPFGWETFPDYLSWLEGRVAVNVVTQVGHSAVRRFVMGEAALERAANEDEIAEMVGVVEAAIDAGAAGISSSQAPHQRGEHGEHIPSFFADSAETHALADAVRRAGARLLSINPATKRDGLTDEDRAFLVELAEISKAIVSWNDFGMGTPNGESVL
jgi:N-acyl-D-aspartate/D-glutamate deacylase